MRWSWLPLRGKALIAAGIVALFFYAFQPLLLILSAILIVLGILTIS
ncbi:hypothetical protein [Massiliimalia massiliensis]|jgi:hypothetical protein|nr:hypothetical protein [Massiliimalia massiliensis]MBS1473948.1 hypothetical protein [Massiliimalia sp.]